jgi:RNA polymerase sigma-70 factor (ECF subfamily)|tara:strand:+ start:1888 stop:2463 length:576 start_codon:yes stop_codon:yes gene_type:complete
MLLEPCDEGIVLKVTQDQRQELADFYRRIEQRAYRMVMIETRHSGDAMDLVQDAMESLMKSYVKKPPEQWRPLFYRILQNKIKDWHRWGSVRAKFHFSKPEQENGEDWLESQVESLQPIPEKNLQGEMSMKHLQYALSQLSLRQRQTFLLRVWEGFSVNETAHIMKCSSGSVKTHLSRALKSLQNLLEDAS